MPTSMSKYSYVKIDEYYQVPLEWLEPAVDDVYHWNLHLKSKSLEHLQELRRISMTI